LVEPPRTGGELARDAAPPASLVDARAPWEARRDLGLGRAFVRTLVLSVREPARFYALVPRDASPLPALVYAAAFDVPVALLTFAYQKAVGEAEFRTTLAGITPALREVMPRAPELIERALGGSALATLLLTPVSSLLELLATATLTWIGLRLTRALRTSFGTLLRLFAYASWIHLFGLLGVTGDVLLSGLSFVLTFGLASYTWLVIVRQSQHTDTRRAVYVSLVGGLVAMAFACVVVLPLLVLLVLWALANVDLPKLSP
jgi:hypothetical protein